ncbi:diaminopimelate decarboxylase [Nocardiopsis ansamitocini]|uniref:Diaminopimelate decarboxylase n=1 Tax=Nocardiopsis ansamitocini TaxID=1670832 RepID=A0A9W6P7W3_9ACTN|nr:diaminopimelate decarboxylase [Nocardiopsis ansamitocini]GLU48687.1 diaminopimelate decarboxylase [Nocardiopsis ansamitocini]
MDVEVESLKFLSPDDVRMVAERFGTPTFVYDEATIKRAAAEMAALPNAFGLTVRYSLKACPSQAIIRLFDREGFAFDASSVWEARRAVLAGVHPGRISLTAQEAVFDHSLKELIDQGLQFDAGSLHQLTEYGKQYPSGSIAVRVNPGFGSGLVNRLNSGGVNSSFGIWHDQIPEMKAALEEYGLKLVRLQSHIGSGHHWNILVDAVKKLLAIARQFPDVQTLDLGGGYRVKALLSDPEYDHTEWARVVADELTTFAEETGRRLRIEVEPGTFLTALSGALVTRVIDRTDTGSEGQTFLKINSGLTEIARPSYYGVTHPLVSVPAEGPLRTEVEKCNVVGHCCIAGDVLTAVYQPEEALAPASLGRTEIGDYLVIERAGSYCSSMSMKNFNSYPEAAEVLRRADGSLDLIRSRQTLEQLVANEVIPSGL